MSSLSSQGMHDESQGVQRGMVGAGYGPYAVSRDSFGGEYEAERERLMEIDGLASLDQYTLPTGQSREPLSNTGPGPSRFPSKESSSSFDSLSMAKTGAAVGAGGATAAAMGHRHNLSYGDGQPPATPMQDSATTTYMLWDNGKDDMDDALHTPDPKGVTDSYHFDPFSLRGWINALAIFVLLAALVVLFAGWPIIVFYRDKFASNGSNTAGFNLGGINATGQVPKMPDFASLIDKDTPGNVMSRTGFDGMEYQLVFSDEFNTDGRTFYPGDDPFWEAVDLHCTSSGSVYFFFGRLFRSGSLMRSTLCDVDWPTGDMEWYDPGQITTKDGSLVIEMREEPTHGLDYRSGMLQSWNKFCFSKNAYIEGGSSSPRRRRRGVWRGKKLGD